LIHLLVPGLLGPFPRFEEGAVPPRLPAVECLLARAERQRGPQGYARALFRLFGVDVAGLDDGDLPTAPLCHHADSGGVGETRYLLHADPIHLRPDQDRLLGFDLGAAGEVAPPRGVSVEEAHAFAEAFNRHFAGEGLELLTPHPARWYLALEQPPKVGFRPLAEIIGRNIDLFLPQGAEGARWRAWMNETQMLFHGLPVNQAREAAGAWPVSGLWFSGGGRMPRVPGGLVGTQGAEVAGCCLARGLMQRAARQGSDRLLIASAPQRAVLDGDPKAWREALAALDGRLAPLMREELLLYACDGWQWLWRPAMRRRWWRRPRPLSVG
jgi:hypothetical protein